MRTLVSLLLLTVFAVATSSPAQEVKADQGFTLLFNGKDLTGWKAKKGGDSLDGKADAFDKRFTVKDGKLIIDPKVKGDIIIETAKSFDKDFTIKFEYLPDEKCNNDLFIRGQKFDITAKLKGIKVGEWNQFEIVCAGDKIEFKNNGDSQRTAKPAAGSPFGVRAEFGAIEIRKLQYKE